MFQEKKKELSLYCQRNKLRFTKKKVASIIKKNEFSKVEIWQIELSKFTRDWKLLCMIFSFLCLRNPRAKEIKN